MADRSYGIGSKLAALCAISILLIVGIWFETINLYNSSRKQDQDTITRVAANRISSHFIGGYSHSAKILAKNEVTIKSLLPPKARCRSAQSLLQTVKDLTKASLIFIMDRDGNVIESTVFDTEKTLIGDNYSFRPYFNQAIVGKPFVSIAKGIATNKRGVYFSHPIIPDQSEVPIGVLVVKAGLDYCDKLLEELEYPAMLISDNGIVFSSNRQDWILKLNPDISPATQAHIEKTRQLGNRPMERLPFQLDASQESLRLNDTDYRVSANDALLPGWRLITLDHSANSFPSHILIPLISGILALSLLLGKHIITASKNIYLEKEVIESEQKLLRANMREHDHRKNLEQAETAQMISEERFRTIIRSAEDCIFLKDTKGRYIMTNPSLQEIFGMEAKDFIGKTDEEVIGAGFSKSTKETDRKTLDGAVVKFEISFKVDGKEKFFNVVKAPIRDNEGRIIGLCGIARDTTEAKAAAQSLIRVERMAAVGTLASGIAHEFNNVTTSILGFAELALTHPNLDPETHSCLTRIRNAILRIGGITQNLLTFVGNKQGNLEPANIVKLIEEALALATREIESQRIELEMHLQPVPDTLMDEGQIGQVILNLLINATHAMLGKEKKKITVASSVEGNHIVTRISDTGCGIAESEIPQIFSPFFTTKGEHAKPGAPQAKVRGTGLGLSVSHTIVTNHNGSLTVESEEGVGSCFTLRLPIVNKEIEEKPKAQKSSTASFEGSRVLVLDDEEDTRELLTLFLNGKGFNVFSTGNGHEALALAQEDDFDLVLVDLFMANMDGKIFLKKLLNLKNQNPPIAILITGQIDALQPEERKELGIYTIIHKPFELETVSKIINNALSTRAPRELTAN